MSYDLMMMPPCVGENPSPAALAQFRGIFEPYLYYGGLPVPEGDEKWQADTLRWPATPPPGYTELEEWKWLQVGGFIDGLAGDDGCICINRPSGHLVVDVVYRAAQETGWIMYDGMDFYAVNDSQVDWWLQHGMTLDGITQVRTVEEWRRWHGW